MNTESTRDEVREQLYIAFQRLDDIETTIADATPEELPQLHSKLEALSTRLTADIEQALATYLDQQITKAQVQTSLDIHARLKDEFMRRELSSDKMPKGYRKMTNEEILTKVIGSYSFAKADQLTKQDKEK